MTGSCPVSARVCQETARERDELRAEVERLRRLATWLTRLDEPDGIEERRTVTLTKIIDRARQALNPTEGETDE